jgi:glutamine amidotransferase
MIAVIDYGLNNLSSVEKALKKFSPQVKVTSAVDDIVNAQKIVLPGVGAFRDAVLELEKRKIFEVIRESILGGVPFLGICLGHQLLFEQSQEAAGVKGFGIFKGEVVRFKAAPTLKVPHMGWNSIKIKNKSKIFSGVDNGAYVYFCHSYYAKPLDKTIIAATTDYGMDFVSAIAKDNIFSTQFHLEKSQKVGLKILENFVKC